MIKFSSLLVALWTASAMAQTGSTQISDLEVTSSKLSTEGDAPILSIGGTQTDMMSPGQNMDPFLPPHALVLGGQRTGRLNSSTATDLLNTGALIIIRGIPDGFMDMGCQLCLVMTKEPVFSSRAGLSGNLNIASHIADDPSFDTVSAYMQPGTAEPALVLEDVTYDATHIYLPNGRHLTPQQIARIHPNQYIVTNSITPDVAAPEYSKDSGIENPISGSEVVPHNYYVSLVEGVAEDGSSISVQGWGVHSGNTSGHAWKTGDVPTTIYDTKRSDFGKPVAMIGAPTQAGGVNVYAAFDPASNRHSLVDRINGAEFDLHYMGTASNQASMTGLLIAVDCSGPAKTSDGACFHPTYDSTGILINGPNLPNGIQNNVPGWANEYKGYNFYIPGSKAPNLGRGNRHTSFESQTPIEDGHVLVTRQWVEQANRADNPVWGDYRVNFGLNIDGERWNPRADTGSDMGYLSFNYSAANLGGVCLVGNKSPGLDKDIPGFCVRNDGTAWFGNSPELPSGLPLIARANVNGATQIGATLSGNNQGDWVIGTQVSGGANLRGVNGIYAKRYFEELQTPSSSSAACIAGQFTDDANYHYVCVGTNHWRRVALSDF